MAEPAAELPVKVEPEEPEEPEEQEAAVTQEDDDDIFATGVAEEKEVGRADEVAAATVAGEGEEAGAAPGGDGEGKAEAADAGEAGEPDGNKKKKKKEKRLGWVNKIETLYLDVFQGGKLVEQIPLGSKVRVLIGRTKEAEICLHNPSISRKHAAICVGIPPNAPAMDKGGITLLDLKSNNKSYYSAKWPCRPDTRMKVPKGGAVTLKEGMCFRFGESSRSFVVRGLLAPTQIKSKNPNFKKDGDVGADIHLARDLGLRGAAKKRGHGALITKNPFQEKAEIESTPFLPTVSKGDDVLKSKLDMGGTTFSFHKKRKSEMDNIKFEHEHKMRKRVLEMKRAEATAQAGLDMQTK